MHLDQWEHICEICARVTEFCDTICTVLLKLVPVRPSSASHVIFNLFFYQWSNSFICLCRWVFYSINGLHEDDLTFCSIRMLARKIHNSCRFSSFAKSILGGIVLLDNLIRNVVRGFYYIEKINFEMHTNICVRWSLITLHLL